MKREFESNPTKVVVNSKQCSKRRGEPGKTMAEPTASDLKHSPEDAKWVWQEAARIMALHRELAVLYRSGGRDKRTIKTLWERIDEGEYALRAVGVYL